MLSYKLPDAEHAALTLQSVLGGFVGATIDWDVLAAAAKGLSYADIVRAGEDAAKEMVLGGRKKLGGEDVIAALEARSRAHAALSHEEH